jgi:hypothetical protein
MQTRAIALLSVCVTLAQAQSTIVRVAWNQIPEVLAGKYALVELESGTTVEGSWTDVIDDAFVMVVERSSGTNKQLKGHQTIARSAVRRVRFREKRVRGRVIGMLAGYYAIVCIAGAATRSREAMQGWWGIVAVAGGVGGYQIGKSADRRTSELVIEP